MDILNRNESRTKKRNRERILEAAEKLFLEKGIYGTTMIDIASEAGVERRTLYNYYENMEILAMELQVLCLLKLQKAWIDVDPHATGFEQARALLSSYCEFCIDNPELVNYTVQFDHYFRKSYENEAYERFMKEYTSKGNNLTQALKKGLADGTVFVDPHSIDKLSITIVQSLMGLAQRIIFREPIYQLEYGYSKEDIRHIVDILLFGIKG